MAYTKYGNEMQTLQFPPPFQLPVTIQLIQALKVVPSVWNEIFDEVCT